ncbi:MAG: methylmalonyl-CoA epimerase [Bacteriovoracaceae bacterium]|nr:methylmalonyl-CoA epimerase [Bacteriovoracaceae bacterium]
MEKVPELEDAVLDHIAIAVQSIETSLSIYEDLGFKFQEKREVVEEQGVKTAFARIDQTAHLELLEPTHDKSPIYQFIDRKGQGIHHICVQVRDVKKKTEELKNKGYRMIYDHPMTGAGGHMVNFIHPKSTGGVLIEISQKVAVN